MQDSLAYNKLKVKIKKNKMQTSISDLTKTT